jgi:hypothetical protein
MPNRGRKGADETLLAALACGATIDGAARQAGVSRRTAQRRTSNPEFLRRLAEARTDMVQRASGGLTAAAMESVKTLLALQQGPANPPAVRLGAARAVLEIGMKLRGATELEERLAVVERRLADQEGQPLVV